MKGIVKSMLLLFVSFLFVFGGGLAAPRPAEAAKKKVRLSSSEERQIRRELERRFGKNLARQIENEARREARRRGLL